MQSFITPPTAFRFGLFKGDLLAPELRLDQPFQFLALRLHDAGQVVPREELHRALWPNGTIQPHAFPKHSGRPESPFNFAAIGTVVAAPMFCATPGHAQSTFGTILGSVTDPSGAVVPKAVVTATNTDENTARELATNGNGDYEFVNAKPGHYKVEAQASGFQNFTARNLQLAGRQVLRVDVRLRVGPSSTSLDVEGAPGVIATDTQAIQSSVDSRGLLDLPVNIRAGGSTSAYWLLAALPGVQPDDNGSYSIQGGIPSMSQFSVDGISITDVRGNGPISEAYPSLEGIAEIKVQGVGSATEFGHVGDVTTISRSGTNQLHGALYWYHQNRALDAMAFGEQSKPQKIGNDFGVSAGGPLVFPGLYNGKNKTFFFGDDVIQ